MGRRAIVASLRLPSLLLFASLLFFPLGSFSATVSPLFTLTPVATGLSGPTALALGPPGPYEGRLLVLTRALGGETSRLLSLDETGQTVVVAEGLRAPAGFFLGSGGTWGDVVYVLEGAPGLGGAPRLLPLAPSGVARPFSLSPGGARVPGGLALGPGGTWGEALYLTDAGEGQLLRLEPAGAITVLRKGLSGPRALAFAPAGSPFGEGLHLVSGNSLLRLTPEGGATVVVEKLFAPGAFAFGGAFGTDLYLVEGGLKDNRLLRYTPEGIRTVIAEGFGPIGGLAFVPGAPLGPALFLTDSSAGIIYRLTPVGP